MIAQLSELSNSAEPTPFHRFLRSLDDRGKLLRVYTQNIDAIEVKSGLSFGVPEYDDRRGKTRSKGGKPTDDTDQQHLQSTLDQPSTSRLPSPASDTPRCIPLHGTLQMLHCQICNHSFPLEDHISSLTSGTPPNCPECTAMERTRQLVGKRPRGVGKLRPSVVLYNEAHKDGEGVGEVVRKDLIGSSKGKGKGGADLLLVVGTSLRVPGTKRMVREFAKAVHSRGTSKEGSTSAAPSPAPRAGNDEESPLKALYLNLDFPVPTREWEGVFDAWLQGDAQTFADRMQREIEKENKAKDLAEERRRRKEEETASPKQPDASKFAPTKPPKKRPAPPETPPPKRQKATLLPTPPTTQADRGSDKRPFPVSPIHHNASRPNNLFSNPHSPTFRRLIPEVVLTRQTPSTPTKKKFHFAAGRPPPTPEKSPPRIVPPEGGTARRDTYFMPVVNRIPYSPFKAFSRRTLCFPSLMPEPDDGEPFTRLQESYVRTVQS